MASYFVKRRIPPRSDGERVPLRDVEGGPARGGGDLLDRAEGEDLHRGGDDRPALARTGAARSARRAGPRSRSRRSGSRRRRARAATSCSSLSASPVPLHRGAGHDEERPSSGRRAPPAPPRTARGVDLVAATGVMSASIAFIASRCSGISPFSARRRIVPGMRSRLISFVPSKIRLIRSSR